MVVWFTFFPDCFYSAYGHTRYKIFCETAKFKLKFFLALKQFCHLVDGQPYRFVLKLHFKFRLSVLRLEEN